MSDTTNTTVDPEEGDQADTYHDRDALIRTAMTAGRISGMFLVFFGAIGVLILVFIYWYFKGQLNLLQLIIYALTALVPFFLGGFFWVVSKMLSEWVYLFMDIEDNTRLQKPKNG